MKMNNLAPFVLLSLIFFPAPSNAESNAPKTQQSCEAAGGVWAKFGLLGSDLCNMKTKDGGKPCRSRSDCESACITENMNAGQEHITGHCYEWSQTLGTCLAEVENGKANGVLCSD